MIQILPRFAYLTLLFTCFVDEGYGFQYFSKSTRFSCTFRGITTRLDASLPSMNSIDTQYHHQDDQYNIRLLCRMIVQHDEYNTTKEFFYAEHQIEELIQERKIKVFHINQESGLYPLRYSIRLGRRDVVKVLQRHGASAQAEDSEGMVIEEVFRSPQPGHLYLLTDLLEGVSSASIQSLMEKQLAVSKGTSKVAARYWLQRGLSHVLPRSKLLELGIPRLDALKYRIVGQSYALEQVLSEIASNYANTELSKKPLVLLFAGPPGHGKSETAKQLADLLGAPYHKVDCRNHANPWEMFGSGAGYIGSDSGSQLGNFMQTFAHSKRSIVLLDEFDHCDPETWEAFYHIFEEGEYTFKKVDFVANKGTEGPASRVLDCSKTIWLLTTNRFDNDIVTFNEMHRKSIAAFKQGRYVFDTLNDKFEEFIRPKLRSFFKGGLTRRINAIVPFFCFDEEEAHVVTDMYIDYLRQMYRKPATNERKIGEYSFDVTNFATGEISRAYFKHQLDGATAIVREVNSRIVKKIIHMKWAREEEVASQVVVVHASSESSGHEASERGAALQTVSALSDEMAAQPPYFLQKSSTGSKPLDMIDEQRRTGRTLSVLETLEGSDWTDPFSRTASQPSVRRRVSSVVEERAQTQEESLVASPSPVRNEGKSQHDAIQQSEEAAIPKNSYLDSGHNEVENQTMEPKSELVVPQSSSPATSYVNMIVYFFDNKGGFSFSNQFEQTDTLETVRGRVCRSLLLNETTVRLWAVVREGDTVSLSTKVEDKSAGGRAWVTERTDLIGNTLYIRNSSMTIRDLLHVRSRLGYTSMKEVLVVYLEMALPTTKFSEGIKFGSDVTLASWRNELKENDRVDFLPDVMEGSPALWREARVLQVTREYDGERSVTLRLLGPTDYDDTDVKMRCSSLRLQPLHSESPDWRSGLTVGDILTLRVTRGQWLPAVLTLIDRSTDEVQLKLIVGDGTEILRRLSLQSEDFRPTDLPSSPEVLRSLQERMKHLPQNTSSISTSNSVDHYRDVDAVVSNDAPEHASNENWKVEYYEDDDD